MGWVFGTIYGNGNRSGVCGTWQNEREVMARVPAARLRASAGLVNGSVNETEWLWDPPAEELQRMVSHRGRRSGAHPGGPMSIYPGDTEYSSANQQAWMEGRHKLFGCNSFAGGPVRYFLYDLVADPYEMHDLSSGQPQRVAAMRRALAAWIVSVAKSTGPAEANCRALGPTPFKHLSHAPGVFTPVKGLSNCTWEPNKSIPGGQPTLVSGIATREACCSACLYTTWCTLAIYGAQGERCSMYAADDARPLKAGQGMACTTGRHKSKNDADDARQSTATVKNDDIEIVATSVSMVGQPVAQAPAPGNHSDGPAACVAGDDGLFEGDKGCIIREFYGSLYGLKTDDEPAVVFRSNFTEPVRCSY
jgi:hypothetical protein